MQTLKLQILLKMLNFYYNFCEVPDPMDQRMSQH